MNFYIIHPTIIDLYINALTLHILQEQLGNLGPQGLTKDIQAKVEEAAGEYVLSASRAEKLFGSPDIVQKQLNAFSFERQGNA